MPRWILNFTVILKVIKVKIPLLFFLAKLTSKCAYLCMELFLLWCTGVLHVLSGVELLVYAWMYWIIQHKCVIFSECVPNECLVIYSAESSLSDRSKRFTIYTPTYLFIPTPTRLLCKAYPSIVRYSFIQLRELGVVELANSAPLWSLIVFIGRHNLQFVYDSDSAACTHYASKWSVQSTHYRTWYNVVQNPLIIPFVQLGCRHVLSWVVSCLPDR